MGGWTPGSTTRRSIYEEKESAKVRAAAAAKRAMRDAMRGRERPNKATTPASSGNLLTAVNTLPPEQRQALLERLTRGDTPEVLS